MFYIKKIIMYFKIEKKKKKKKEKSLYYPPDCIAHIIFMILEP